ncbi:ataxin-10 isoform X2 [Paroedura picta]|uniref:ataxin-10 isoform X2 n=1 Tax=Paroedura picta TaxID=143630 RepID=UPI004057653C
MAEPALLEAVAGRLGQAAAPSGCLATARQLTGLFREARHRENATEHVFQNLMQILTKATSEVDVACKDVSALAHLDDSLLLLSECFRCLRNACVQCAKNQDIMRSMGLIEASVHLIQVLQKLETDLESSLTAFRCGLQFLGNIATGNIDSQERIWKLAFPALFMPCLNHRDEKIVEYCSMILFTCLNPERTRALEEENHLDIALAVLQACRKYPESEWAFLIVTNHLLKCPELVKAMYARLSNQERTVLLELILSEISDKNSAVFKEMDMFLASCFQEKCQSVLRLASAASSDDEEALVILRLLDTLCEMTSDDGQLERLQACPDLLEAAVRTLQLAHLSGKQATNVFTPIHATTGQEQISHPAVGFKSHLIRLIANLCYSNKANQDKVYELDGIPLILDNCSIDDNNPFISQWAVYAIHNLTEQNERNQELIARMEQQGLVDSSILEKTGLKVEREDQKLILRSIRKTPDL